jgi:FkbM family methyltransferase
MSLLGQVVRLPLAMVAKDRPVRVLTGPLRGARWLPGSATHGCWLGTYERRTQQVFRNIVAPGDAVFDVGAHVGFYTLLAARLTGPGGRVVAFEPLPRNVDFLRRHVDANRLGNVSIVQAAVAERSGSAHFTKGGGPSTGSLVPRGSAVELAIDLVCIDDLVGTGELPAPRVVKIDVEGAESRVLEGGRRTFVEHRPKVVLSGHGWEQSTLCSRMLESFGYNVTVLRDGARDGNYAFLAA